MRETGDSGPVRRVEGTRILATPKMTFPEPKIQRQGRIAGAFWGTFTSDMKLLKES